MTTSASRGSATVMSLRLCSRAPETTNASDRAIIRSVWNRTDVPLWSDGLIDHFQGYRSRAGSTEKGTRMSRSRCALAVALVAVAASPPTPASGQAGADQPACKVGPGARCSTLDVPMDATGAVPGTQRLGYAVLPA